MALNNWVDADTIKVYVDLSMRDVDDKDLMVHGFKSKEEILRPISQARPCGKCGEENARVAIYFLECGEILAAQDLDRVMADRGLMEEFVNHPTFQEVPKRVLNVQ